MTSYYNLGPAPRLLHISNNSPGTFQELVSPAPHITLPPYSHSEFSLDSNRLENYKSLAAFPPLFFFFLKPFKS